MAPHRAVSDKAATARYSTTRPWGPSSLRLAAAVWLSLLGLAVGLSKGEVFFHALVLSSLPGAATRIAAVVAIGAGVAGAVLGCLAYVRAG